MSKEVLNSKERIVQRATMRAMGLSNSDIEKPLIGIITTNSKDTIALEKLKIGIFESGGTPLVFDISHIFTNSPYTLSAEKYALPYRELVADTVETIIGTQSIDGVVMMSNEHMALAGMAIALVRTNLPAIMLNSGIVDSDNTLPHLAISYAKNKGNTINVDQLLELENLTDFGDSTLSGNAFLCALEVLGLTLPNVSTTLKNTSELYDICRKTGNTILELVKNDIRPKMILNKNSFTNALNFVLSLGISFDAILHLLAFAIEAGIKMDFDTIKSLSDKVPTLLYPFNDKPIGIKEFKTSGGVMSILQELSRVGLIDGTTSTVSKTLANLFSNCNLDQNGIVSTTDTPLSPTSGIGVLYGDLAGYGALYNRKNFGSKTPAIVAKSKVFDCVENALTAINLGKISSGDAIVVRFEGVKGSPGMRSVTSVQNLLMGLGLSKNVYLITDGRASLNYDGIVICAVCPEAIEGGKIGILKDGDKVVIDFNKSKLDIDLPSKEINTRLKKFDNKDIVAIGYLRKYCNSVQSANVGANTKPLSKK